MRAGAKKAAPWGEAARMKRMNETTLCHETRSLARIRAGVGVLVVWGLVPASLAQRFLQEGLHHDE
jgi:hypothetical protein